MAERTSDRWCADQRQEAGTNTTGSGEERSGGGCRRDSTAAMKDDERRTGGTQASSDGEGGTLASATTMAEQTLLAHRRSSDATTAHQQRRPVATEWTQRSSDRENGRGKLLQRMLPAQQHGSDDRHYRRTALRCSDARERGPNGNWTNDNDGRMKARRRAADLTTAAVAAATKQERCAGMQASTGERRHYLPLREASPSRPAN